jgi:hypothetical protein
MEMAGPDWAEWARHPQTQAFKENLRETARQHQQDWLDGAYESDSTDTWIKNNAAAMAVAGYATRLAQDIDALTKEEGDEK